MTKKIEVSVVAFQDGDVWVAQCVEYDIAAFAKSLAELPKAFERAVAANLCVNADLGQNGMDGIPAAPERYRVLFDAADMTLTSRKAPSRSHRPPVKIRDLRLAVAA
jgi:hypothetical protein